MLIPYGFKDFCYQNVIITLLKTVTNPIQIQYTFLQYNLYPNFLEISQLIHLNNHNYLPSKVLEYHL